jgi:hypothetical protein
MLQGRFAEACSRKGNLLCGATCFEMCLETGPRSKRHLFVRCLVHFCGSFCGRLGLGQLVGELIRAFLPGLDEGQVADIMEEVVDPAETPPLQVDIEELRAVLEGDAVVLQERLGSATEPPSASKVMEREIAEHAVRLRGAARAKSTVAQPPAANPPAANPPESAPAALHWTGKGGAHWTSQDNLLSSATFITRLCWTHKC